MTQRLAWVLCILSVVCCLIAPLFRSSSVRNSYRASGRQEEIRRPSPLSGSVSVNTADPEELTCLPGIGKGISEAILVERSLHGPFFYPEDLLAVKGIGQSRLKDIRPWINLE